ncbi:hypothetical protein QTI51_12225 [Variovorax sp. J22G73]|jgi:hypothetical protein|uniref:hypothetical protein n=1 Tax=unclassified Variovorax TaxID=663243 RepID=UPI00104716CF|nr:MULTISPECIES: hypothetical protein [unclassified Variovorax]MDM0005931.1 hypothetical protein [Variovorax sp. J22R203]MDM0098045.1 hypothetical protein [Variovorax sp. J22G73]
MDSTEPTFFNPLAKGKPMIRRPRQGNEATAQLASQLGCTLVEAVPRHGHARPALVGCDPELSQRMKALGARWDSFNNALAFAGWPALQAALRYALDKRANGANGAEGCSSSAGGPEGTAG